MLRTLLTLAFLGLAAATPAAAQEKASQQKPNVVIILADDFGYECVGANGGGSYKTPNLDKLAAKGTRFEHCYVQPLCTPTRVQLLTGQSNKRNYVRWATMPPNAVTFAQLFRAAGYATAVVGKWQLGQDPKLPQRLGFDAATLWQHTRRGSRYINPSHDVDGKAVDYTNGEYGPDLESQFAIDFVRRHKEQRFCLFYSMTLTHGPYQPPPGTEGYDPAAKTEFVGAHKKHFGALVRYMDGHVGKLIDAIDALGLAQNTLILFVGDNGTGEGLVSLLDGVEFVGGKGSMTIAGMRVPLLARWTGTIPAGRTCGDLIESTDFLPTMCEAAGVAVPKDHVVDGRSFWPQLRGEKGQPRDHYHCWFWPRPAADMPAREFVANHHYKLYADGKFYAYRMEPQEKAPLSTLTGEQQAIRASLQQALDRYRDIRPIAVPEAGKSR